MWSLASPLCSSLHVAKPESEECYQFFLFSFSRNTNGTADEKVVDSLPALSGTLVWACHIS